MQIIGDIIYMDGDSSYLLTVHEGTVREKFKSFLERCQPEEADEPLELNVQCHECNHSWTEYYHE